MKKELLVASLFASAAILPQVALAQDSSPAEAATTGSPSPDQDSAANNGFQDIVVTARKSSESFMKVPVVMSAIDPTQIAQRNVVNLEDVARIVPQLTIAGSNGSPQGGFVAIRGVSAVESNPLGDQAVSFDIDGVQIAKSSVRLLSNVDMAGIEVLKGPQALFFGKNSPAGVVSIRTADPGSEFDAMARMGHEFEAREKKFEGMVSVPLTDDIGIRVAGFYYNMDGWLKNVVRPGGYLDAGLKRDPKTEQFGGRITLKAQLTDNLSAKLKVSAAKLNSVGIGATVQPVYCVTPGQTQTGIPDDCRANGVVHQTGTGSNLHALDPGFRADGKPYSHQTQVLVGLELNYDITDELSLASTTGFYYTKVPSAFNATADYLTAVPSYIPYRDKEFSQEIRLTSDYDSPVNFVAGAYFGSGTALAAAHTFFYAAEADSPFASLGCTRADPCQLNNYYFEQKSKAYSAFLQLRFKPIEQIAIDAGGRYTRETKRLSDVRDGYGAAPPNALGIPVGNDRVPVTLTNDSQSWNDFSPELSLSYFPTSNVTIFGSYKRGFLSGGFNPGLTGFTDVNSISYDPQTIKGFEAGLKTVIGGRLRFNLSAYTYRSDGLQLGNYVGTVLQIRNAGSSRVKGVEADFQYRTPIDGLDLRGSASYNKGRYISFANAPCYPNQTVAQGCTGVSQDLSGTELYRAPKWALNAGFSYEYEMANGWKFGASADTSYSNSFLTDPSSDPNGRHPNYQQYDASVNVQSPDEAWQLALIGKNLSDKHLYFTTYNVPFGGGDRQGGTSRGREVLMQLTWKFR